MPTALAVFAHPDDIEFVAAGTLLLLHRAGWTTHYLNTCSGNLGSATLSPAQARETRRHESQQAAALLGAKWHPPLVDDMEIVYGVPLLRQLAAVVRDVRPDVLLTHAPQDYMEDHTETARLAVSAAFARGMPNFHTDPPRPHIECEVTVYHAQPHMNRDPLDRAVRPTLVVDVSGVMDAKRAALSAHVSQKAWLDQSQGMDSYVHTMEALNREVGAMTGVTGAFAFAEGWRRRLHAGYCAEAADPLHEALRAHVLRLEGGR
jgi:N-acetylglucosamine malate deacetylase 1